MEGTFLKQKESDVRDEEDLEDLDLMDEFGDEYDVDAPITSKSLKTIWMGVLEGFVVRVEKADNVRFTATYIVQDYDWRIHASKLMDGVSWAIKSIIGEHKLCGRLEENPMVSSAWLVRHLREGIIVTPDIPVESLQTLCMNRFRVKTNPGSYALITWTGTSEDDGPRFKGCSFSFIAQAYYRIDGAHLSGYYKGTLLIAVGIDENNEIFPIAYGIVDNESIESWSYFFRNIRLLFRGEGVEKDDSIGVEAALYEVFPQATRRICNQHLYMNCKTAGYSGGAFQTLFKTAADAYNTYVFKKP
ncbi:Transposase for insertion sequence element ISRM5 [Bienertia sinuspersici]